MTTNTHNTASASKTKTYTMALTGVMAAVTCILGPLSIPLPFSPVPVSLTNFAIYIAIYVLGTRTGTLSYLIYLLIGFAGVPVFSSFTAGPAKLLGPTGGYLTGFIFMAVICGLFTDHWRQKMLPSFAGMVLGTAVCYLFGTLWLAFQAGMTFENALLAGVIPFIPGDLGKIVIAMLIGPRIRRGLVKAGVCKSI